MAMWKVYLFLVATVAVVAAQQPIYSENVTNHNGHMVLLGGLFPISENEGNQCGSLRTTAVEALEAMVYAIRTINADPALLPYVNLTFDIRDTCSIPNKALENSLSYVQTPLAGPQDSHNTLAVSGVVGAGFFSHVSMGIASLFRLFQIPQISYGSSASELNDRVRFDYFFRTLPPDSYLARAMADVVIHFDWSYVIALHSDDVFGKSGLEVMLDKIVRQNTSGKCTAVKIPLPLVVTEGVYDSIVERINQPWVINATVVLMYGYKRQTTGIMRAIEKVLQNEPRSPLRNLTWVGCEALRVDSQYHHLLHGMLRMEYKVNMSYGFQQHFTAATPTFTSSNPHFRNYWETKFNCSINRVNGKPGCDAFDLSNYKQKNEISSIIDAVYAFAHTIHGLVEEYCIGHTLCPEIMARQPAGMAVNGTMIRDYLLYNLSFPGLSADIVQFDADGNDQSSYVVKNLQRQTDGSYEYVIVGTWNPQSLLNINTTTIDWNDDSSHPPESVCSYPCSNGSFPEFIRDQDCCWTCKPCLGDNTVSTGGACSECATGYFPNEAKSECLKNPTYHLTWVNPWAIIIVIATCIGLLTTGLCSMFYLVFHKSNIIKASSRELSAILLVGLMLCYIQPFFFLVMPSMAICAIRRFLVGFCFAVCFSALLVKTNRLHRIFNRSPEQLKTQPRFISPMSQVLITFSLIAVQIFIAVLWLAIEHPSVIYTYARKSTDIKCGASSDIGLIVSLGYNLLLLILSTYFAFLARKIPENFNEAKFINVTLYTIIIIWLAFIPTYFATAKLGSVYQTSSLVLAIILTATTTLGCLFAPKILLLISQLLKKGELDIPNSSIFTTKSSITTTA
jgi:metabotropic glutamate receptor 2/3